MITKKTEGVEKIKDFSDVEGRVVLLKPKALTDKYKKPECQFYYIILFNENTGLVVGNPLDGGKQTKLDTELIMGFPSDTLIKQYFPDYFNKKPTVSKIITYQQAAGFGQNRMFDSGRRTIFKTGCFDILHLGHIKTFQQAKKLADILIVGVGSDAFITQYKKAPLFNEQTRAECVAAIGCVDYVVILEEGPEHWRGTIDHVKFLTDVRPHFYFIPYDDKSLQEKMALANELGISLKIQEPQDDFFFDLNGTQTKLSSTILKKWL